MSDYYWKQAAPTPKHIDYIYQVEYTLHPFTKDIFEVKQRNLYDNITEHRVFLPQRYYDFLRKFLWRTTILMKLYLKYHKRPPKVHKTFIPHLAKLLVHLDNVIEALLRPAVGLSVNEVKLYRSQNFEEFLITEYLLGRHDPAIVQQYRETYDVNIERINLDDLNWDLYHAVRIPGALDGSQYKYDVGAVPSNNMRMVLAQAHEHYMKEIDHNWVSMWLESISGNDAGGSLRDEEDSGDAPSPEDAGAGTESAVIPMDVVAEPQSSTEESQAATESSASRSSTPPPNQLMLTSKRTRQEAMEEEEMPPRKRSGTPAARVQQDPIGFNSSWSLGPAPSD